MNFSVSATNDSTPETPLQRAWLSLSATVAVSGFFVTSCVLLTYAIDRGLSRNDFHIYVQNLLAADWLYFAFFTPLLLFTTPDSGRKYSSWICSLDDYGNLVIADLPCAAHACISLNRLWAIAFPQSYREGRSRKAALGHCAAGILFFHVIGLPPVLVEYMHYRENRAPGCAFDLADQSIGILVFVNTAAVLLCEMIILALYPFVWWKNKVRQQARVGPASRPSGINQRSTDEETSAGQVSSGKAPETQERKAASRAFIALSALTATVFLLWTPFFTYAGVISFSDQYFDADTWAWMNFLASVQTLTDPLVFLISLKDLRHSFAEVIRRKVCRY